MSRPKKHIPDDCLSAQMLADLAGISLRRIYQMRHEAFPPPANDNNLFPLREVGEWLRDYVIRRGERPLKDESYAQLARKNAALADKTELQNAARRSELVEASEVDAAWASIVERVQKRLLQIPAAAAGLIVGAEDEHAIVVVIDDVIRDALSELSRWPAQGA